MLAASLLLFFETRIVEVRWQQSLIGWLLIGLIAGWLAGKLSRGRGYGCISDIVMGILGAFLRGGILGKIAVFGGGFIYSPAAAPVSIVVLLGIVHLTAGGPRD